jgi:hypothetical protein
LAFSLRAKSYTHKRMQIKKTAGVCAGNDEHKALVLLADRWLKRQGWEVVIRDCFKAYVSTRESPDLIAWRYGISIVIECKASRGDFMKDKEKVFRKVGGMGNWRFYLCRPDIIRPHDLDDRAPGWGLLYVRESSIETVVGWPKGNINWYTDKPFDANHKCENEILVSALRRLAVKGMLEHIYRPNESRT